MDPALLIPVLALVIGVIAILKLPRKAFTQGANPELEARLEALEQEVAQLRQELTGAEERLDFTERALTRGEEARRLAKGD